MDHFDLSFFDNIYMVSHSICARCGSIGEFSKIGYGHIPFGPDRKIIKSDKVILCIDCIELLHTNSDEFWMIGWC